MSRILSALFGGVQQSPNSNITAANNARAISVKEAPTFKHPHAADCSDGDAICRAFIILHFRVARRRLNAREGNVRLWAGAERLLCRIRGTLRVYATRSRPFERRFSISRSPIGLRALGCFGLHSVDYQCRDVVVSRTAAFRR